MRAGDCSGHAIPAPEAARSRPQVLTEDELAAWRRAKGQRLVRCRDRWWEEVKPGFYQAIHWMARQRPHEIARPTASCWGSTTLQDEDAGAANGRLPVHAVRSRPL